MKHLQQIHFVIKMHIIYLDNVLFTYEFSYKLHLFSYYYIKNAMKSPLQGHSYVKKVKGM